MTYLHCKNKTINIYFHTANHTDTNCNIFSKLSYDNGRLTVHAVIRQMAGATGPRSYFRFFQNMSVMPSCTNNKTSTATYNGL